VFRVEVLDELVAKFWKQEEWCSRLEIHGTRVYDLILGLPSGRAQLVDILEEAVGQLGAEQAMWWEVDTELEALQNSVVRVRDLVLEWADRPSSLAALLSLAAELLKGRIDCTTANRVYCGTQSMLATALSHFLELGTEIDLLGSKLSVNLIENQVDALWTQVCLASNLLLSYVPPSVARGPPDGTRE
jgi:hypothetical protein